VIRLPLGPVQLSELDTVDGIGAAVHSPATEVKVPVRPGQSLLRTHYDGATET
jgi:hypothetical protein